MEQYTLYELGLMVALISFLGFLTENCWLAFTKGYIDNRNMRLPFLLGYGLLVVGFYLIVGTPEHMTLFRRGYGMYLQNHSVVQYYLLAVLVVSLGELILGTCMEKLCGIIYWDYTWIPLHITRYTSVPTSLGFAALITLFMKDIFTSVMEWIGGLPFYLTECVGVLLMAALVWDFLASFYRMYRDRKLYVRWRRPVRLRYIEHLWLKKG